jgi:iron complex transport system ATP-binding protein
MTSPAGPGSIAGETLKDRPSGAAAPVLEARAVRFRHPGAAASLFEGLSVSIDPGSFVGLIGPNGSGKTTLLKLLGGILEPDAGGVRLEGRGLAAVPPRDRARRIALVLPEAPLLFNFSVLEIVLMGRAPHLGLWGLEKPADYDAARRALREVDLQACEGRPVHDLSSGERQRVLIARALAQEPRVLLLDEPTAYLDLKHGLAIYEILRRLNAENGLTVVTVSHDLNLAARFAGRLVLLQRGRIAADGSAAAVLTRSLLREVYETDAEVTSDPVTGFPLVIPRAPWPGR